MNAPTVVEKLKPKDFATDQEVRWCPGCGDYAILKGVQATLAEIGAQRENTVFISGIGCSSRFPYYMETYGFHTIHGRAPAIASGVKIANPDLDIWIVTGDGDGLSIGGNHLLHVLRRNFDLQILLFNNEIYGLTKGQYSPTSRIGTRSPSTPMGSIDRPLNPARFALGANATFVARTVDTLLKHMPVVLKRAHAHKGASFVEIFQNCLVYNDGVFADFTDRKVAATRQLLLENGKPMRFGADGEMGLKLNTLGNGLEVVEIGGEGGVDENEILIHDETNLTQANLLVGLESPDFPVAMGVIYCIQAQSFTDTLDAQVELAKENAKVSDINSLLRSGNTWTVGA